MTLEKNQRMIRTQVTAWLLAAIGLRPCQIKAEFRTMHTRRARVGQLSAGQYHRPSHVDVGLPLTVHAAGFTSGTNPNLTRHPYTGAPGRCEWALYARWSQSRAGKKCTSKLEQAQTGTKHRKGRHLHTYNRQCRFLQGVAC